MTTHTQTKMKEPARPVSASAPVPNVDPTAWSAFTAAAGPVLLGSPDGLQAMLRWLGMAAEGTARQVEDQAHQKPGSALMTTATRWGEASHRAGSAANVADHIEAPPSPPWVEVQPLIQAALDDLPTTPPA
jgi:hypothetical protein